MITVALTRKTQIKWLIFIILIGFIITAVIWSTNHLKEGRFLSSSLMSSWQGDFMGSDLTSGDGKTKAITGLDINGDGIDEVAYLKEGTSATDLNLYIYSAPKSGEQKGVLLSSDYWSGDGKTKAMAGLDIDGDGVDEVAYLREGSKATDLNLYVYSAPISKGQRRTLLVSDLVSGDGKTKAIAGLDIDGDGIDEVAYLKEGTYGATDLNLYIYSVPKSGEQTGTMLASDFWSGDGKTKAITGLDINGDGIDEVAYLKEGTSATDLNLYIYSAPTSKGQKRTLLASDLTFGDGKTKAITGLDINGDGIDEIAYLKEDSTATDFNIYVYSAIYTNGVAIIDVYADQSLKAVNSLAFGNNINWIWDGNGIFNSETNQLDEARISLIKPLKPSLIRFPGGSLSNYYHWTNGIGPRENRAVTKGLPGGRYHKHNLGTDEMMELLDKIDSQAIITVNVYTGTAQEAAAWVAYTNGKLGDTRGIGTDENYFNWGTVDYWARKRVANCQLLFNKDCSEPYNIKYWEIGNEINILPSGALPVELYSAKLIYFSKQMKNIDSSIKIGAVGHSKPDGIVTGDYLEWNKNLLRIAGNYFDFLAIHRYNSNEYKTENYADILATPVYFSKQLEEFRNIINQESPNKNIKIGVTEYNTSYDNNPIQTTSLKSALFVGDMLRTFLTNQDKIELANIWDLICNQWSSDCGCWGSFASIIKATSASGDVEILRPSYYVFDLYRNHFGTRLLNNNLTSPVFQTNFQGYLNKSITVPYLDILISKNEAGNKIYLLVINKHLALDLETIVNVNEFSPESTARVYTLTGQNIDSNNENGQTVMIKESTINNVKGGANSFTYSFPKHSLTIIELTRR